MVSLGFKAKFGDLLGAAFADFTCLIRDTEGSGFALALGVCRGGAGLSFYLIYEQKVKKKD